MRRARLLSSAALLAAAGALAACGGGGGSPGGGVVTPPPPSPVVTPPVTPPPSTTLTTYPSFARLLVGASVASAFHRNSLDTAAGGNSERVEVTSNGTGRSSQTVAIAVNDPAYTVARTFTPANYLGATGATYLYWHMGGIVAPDRPLQPLGWAGGLLALPLYKHIDGAWTQATVAQAFEYGQTDITPGVNSSLFMVSGPRSSSSFTGSARFLGDAFGTYQGPFATPAVRMRGEMRVEVDFGRSQIRGALTDLIRSPTSTEFLGSQLVLGDVAFSAPLSSSFVAATTSDRGNLTSLAGTVSGEFYGDASGGATEVGGVFALQSSQGAFSGVYIAGRSPLPAGIYSNNTAQTFDGTGGTFFQAMGPAATTSLRWTRSGPGAGQSTATIAYTRDGLNHTMDVFSLIRSEDSLRFNQGGSILLEIVERVAGKDLNYAGLGRWNEDVGSSGWALQQNFVAFGQRATNMPTTGTATYTGSGQGRYLATGEDTLAKGAFQLGANFAAGTVNGNLENSQAKYALSFTAAIAADGFSGTFVTGDALTGDVKGFFAGPGAAEVAGTFRAVDSPSGRSYTGGFVAAK